MPQSKNLLSLSALISVAITITMAIIVLGGITLAAATATVSSVDSAARASQRAGQADTAAPRLDTEYFPAQFAAPKGKPSEPIATF